MLNQVVVVGRIYKIFTGDNKIIVETTRLEKNSMGEYDSDLITVEMSPVLFTKMSTAGITVGSLVGTKGSLRALSPKQLVVYAEKVTFLSLGSDGKEVS